jgi:drug/metabolite transporter (DMT)-like permease
MSWQLLTAMSVLSLSVSVLLQRVLIHRDRIDPFAYAVVFQGVVSVLLMAVALVVGFRLPHIETLLGPALIAVVFFGLGHIVYAKTLQTIEASAFSVLFATQAIWIMLLGIVLFGEKLTALQIVGTVLIFVSVILLVKNIRRVGLDRGTVLGLLTGLMFGIAITAWSYVGRHTDGLSWAAISFVATTAVAFLARPQIIRTVQPLFRGKVMMRLLLLGVFYGLGSLTMLFAYKYGSFAIVSPLRQTSIVVTVLLALLFLKSERHTISRKILAAVICLVGVVLIVM